jgi:hypothetical protein
VANQETGGQHPKQVFHGSLSRRVSRERSLDLRLEGFNVFNHTQFYGSAAVDGQIEDSNFGQIVSSAAPRLVQLAAKFKF